MRVFYSALMLLLITSCATSNNNWSTLDKSLFTVTAISQIADGMTTAHGLSKGNVIDDTWAWKYGSNRPTPARLWTTKAIELSLAYIIADKLDQPYRKIFLIGLSSLLMFYTVDNLSNSAGFRITW